MSPLPGKVDPVKIRTLLLRELGRKPGYGLELHRRLVALYKVYVGQGRLYPTLWQLEEDGLAESYESAPFPSRGGRPRKYYALTVKGRKELDKA